MKAIIDLFFPPLCHICENLLTGDERFLCTTCLSRLPRTLYHRRVMNPMEQRFAGIFPFERATGHFFYSKGSDISNLIQDLKYRHFKGLGKLLGKIVATELYSTGFFSDIDVILPIPMHYIKKAQRGYNQTEEIAKGIAEITSLKICNNLRAVKQHQTQTSLSLTERQQNTEGIFKLSNKDDLKNKHILLLDDVCTTGSTIISAATAIQKEEKDLRLSILTIGVTF